MKLQRCAKAVLVWPDQGNLARAAAAVLKRHRLRLGRWLPFARIVHGFVSMTNVADEASVQILVEVKATQLEVTTETLSGFYSLSIAHAEGATFIDEGSAPVVLVQVKITGSALDESLRFGNARWNYGGLLGDKDRLAASGGDHPRASMDGQQCGTDASLRQAVASA